MASDSTPRIVFATNNSHKLSELRAIAGDRLHILSLSDIGCAEDLPETSDTLDGNALQKARYVASHYGVDCFADDTGLEVDALDGGPGVHTARFAGPECDPVANVRLLLERLEGQPEPEGRRARFRTVIALVRRGHPDMTFEGRVEGYIPSAPRGDDGFGYDPVFVPAEDPQQRTFAQMGPAEKNAISHRARATAALIAHLFGR